MNDLPSPFVPANCDLRGYDFMPLFGHRLFRSDLYETTDGEQFKVAVKLWWEAWNQCPAGSLPNDDTKLCRLADLGRDQKAWAKMREAALRGFVLCSDGRLYHKLLCEWAMDAYERRVRDRERKRRWRVTRDGDGTDPGSHTSNPRSRDGDRGDERRGQNTPSQSPSASGHTPVPDERRGQDRRGEERKEESKKDYLNSFSGSDAREKPEPPTDAVGARATAPVIEQTRKALRLTAYAGGRSPERTVEEQIAALSDNRPQASHATPDELRLLRRRTA